MTLFFYNLSSVLKYSNIISNYQIHIIEEQLLHYPCSARAARLETVQDNVFSMADFLVDQKSLHVCSLITRQLNDFPDFLVLLDGTVARKVLFEDLANSFHVEVMGQTRDSCDTLSSITLLHTNVDILFSFVSGLVSGILKCVWKRKKVTRERNL